MPKQQTLDYVVVLDFEATCNEGREPPSPQEIIEFPSILMSMDTLESVSEFSSFVKPQHHPILTPFCTELTSIGQEQVDGAPEFPEVLNQHMDWLRANGLPASKEETGPSFAFVTSGDRDLKVMFPKQCRASVPPIDLIPPPYRQWINIKRPFANWHGTTRAPGMAGMLRKLNLELTGHHHRGIDDCRNIAKIVKGLVEADQSLYITAKLPAIQHPPVKLTLSMDGVAHTLNLRQRVRYVVLNEACRLFKCRIARAYLPGGAEITRDEDLFDLKPETEIKVTGE